MKLAAVLIFVLLSACASQEPTKMIPYTNADAQPRSDVDVMADRYPQSIADLGRYFSVTRSRTDGQSVVSFHEKTRSGQIGKAVAFSKNMNLGHGDGFTQLNDGSFAATVHRNGRVEVVNYAVERRGDRIRVTELSARSIGARKTTGTVTNALLGRGGDDLVVVTKFDGTKKKRVQTFNQAEFFNDGTSHSRFYTREGALQGVTRIETGVRTVAGGADRPARVREFDLDGTRTRDDRADLSSVPGSHKEFEGLDGDTGLVASKVDGDVRMTVVDVSRP